MEDIFKFSGRLRRSHFLLGVILLTALSIATSFFVYVSFEESENKAMALANLVTIPFFILKIILFKRRFNDFNWSGWSYLLIIIPLLNLVVIALLFFRDGTKGINKYGDDPKARMMIDDMNIA